MSKTEPWLGADQAIQQLRDRFARMTFPSYDGDHSLLEMYGRLLNQMQASIDDHEQLAQHGALVTVEPEPDKPCVCSHGPIYHGWGGCSERGCKCQAGWINQ